MMRVSIILPHVVTSLGRVSIILSMMLPHVATSLGRVCIMLPMMLCQRPVVYTCLYYTGYDAASSLWRVSMILAMMLPLLYGVSL